MKPDLAAKLTLADIFGSNRLFNSRPCPRSRDWLPEDPVTLEMLTGGMLTVVGDMPTLCAASVATPAALQLLRDVGHRLPRTILPFSDDEEHRHHLQNALRQGLEIVLQHAPHPEEARHDSCWIDLRLLSWLNNKAHLGELVPAACRPSRRLGCPTTLVNAAQQGFPFVIKAATDESTGGGHAVMICRNFSDLQQAQRLFNRCSQLVVEDYMAIARNLCLNYAVNSQGEIDYLGSGEQITDSAGHYYGNWFDAQSAAPPDALQAGEAVVRKGFERGYRGVVGIDVAILDCGRSVVYDLNFRLNGSTAPLLLADSIRQHYCMPVLCLATFRGNHTYEVMRKGIYRAVQEQSFVPLVSCDPTASRALCGPPRTGGLILGESRQHVRRQIPLLRSLGLELLRPADEGLWPP